MKVDDSQSRIASPPKRVTGYFATRDYSDAQGAGRDGW